jgi:predicted aldo/keto reductase-like oxidoreductase
MAGEKVSAVSIKKITRREFLEKTTAAAGGVIVSTRILRSAEEGPAKPTATDKVPLGRTGLKICRLGMGTGSNGGATQRALGQDGFTRLIRYGYEHGVTYIDVADAYKTHEMVREAIKGLPRDALWIQSKISWRSGAEKPLEVLDRFRKELGVDTIDSVLIHCVDTADWDTKSRWLMDALSEAKEKKIVRLKGMSCHGLPGLKRAAQVDWADVNLVRVNPQGKFCDGDKGEWAEPGKIDEAIPAIKTMHERGRGVIGMTIIGNGEFTSPEEREKSIRFAMTCGFLDAVVIGFKSPAEIDEAIQRMNAALASRV